MDLTSNDMKRVLVIEDDLATARCLGWLINDLGYKFIQSPFMLTPKEIIKINPDIIILDFYLPNGHGDDLCLQLKENSLTKEIPVILVSIRSDLANIAKSCFADGYLEKPFNYDKLVQMLSKFCDGPLVSFAD